jgi:hypothetical protein
MTVRPCVQLECVRLSRCHKIASYVNTGQPALSGGDPFRDLLKHLCDRAM